MKLLFCIVDADDEDILIDTLIEKNFHVTKLSSSGGFLHKSNTTLMMGVHENRFEEAMETIKGVLIPRKRTVSMAPVATSSGHFLPSDITVKKGGCVCFAVDAEGYKF